MNKKRTIIFSDFDGTFCAKDVGHRLYTHFSGGRNLPLVDEWRKGIITTRECMLKEASLIRINWQQLNQFLDQFELRDGARELYFLAKKSDIPFYIVSDGSDIYIRHILKRNNLEEIPFFSSRATIVGDKFILEFPQNNNGCPRCGSCKGARISEIIGKERDEWEVIFIGDGLSDICALPHADYIYARGHLLDFCRSNNIRAFEYGDFFDILKWLKNSGRILA